MRGLPEPVAWCLAMTLAASTASGDDEIAARDYQALQEWRFGAATPLPATGVTLIHEDAVWRLESGEVSLQEPTSDGSPTGLVFEGRGRFRMTVADPFELAQLRRFAGVEDLVALDEPFSKLVLRSSDSDYFAGLEASDGGYRVSPLARERHDFWLRIRRLDADSRVISALLNPGDKFLRVDVKTDRFGWLTYDYTSRRHEEIRLERFNKRYSFLEQWLSLDSAAERRPSGRPGEFEGRALDVRHVDIAASLIRQGKDPGVSETARSTINGDFVARVELSAARDGLRALQFYLHPFAEVRAVRDESGRELRFLRDHIGGRSSGIDKRIYDHSLVVLLPAPLVAGAVKTLEFDYEFEIRNFMPGRAWYPGVDTIDTALRDLHTARLEVTTRDRYDVRAMGVLEDERTEGDLVTRVWRIERPVKMATFATARKVQESRIPGGKLPEVVVFSTPIGSSGEEGLGEIAADVQASFGFFESLLGVELPIERIQTTLIQSSHGQAFDGFLHLSEDAAFRNRTGPVELFIAHEVAHQWAGHGIGWASYRDQWLSEGLAQYLALLYMKENVEGGDELFLEAIQAHTNEITGSIKSTLSPFSRGSLPLDNKLAAGRVGPVGHGYRAAVGEAPAAFLSQSYRKGALVLYMLERLIGLSDAGEGAFRDVLRDFCSANVGRYPSTDDFRAAVERRVGGDWEWFFDQWVYGSAVPSYRWKASVDAHAAGGHRVEIDVSQSDVPDGFRMPVPVRLEFSDGDHADYLVTVDKPQQTLEILVDRRPRKVVFNPDYAVLATTGKR